MKVLFKHNRKIDGRLYTPGVHELLDSLAGHWFFKGLVDAKDVKMLDEPSSSVPASIEFKEEESVLRDEDAQIPTPKKSKKKGKS